MIMCRTGTKLIKKIMLQNYKLGHLILNLVLFITTLSYPHLPPPSASGGPLRNTFPSMDERVNEGKDDTERIYTVSMS